MEGLCDQCKSESPDCIQKDGNTSLIQAAKLDHYECLCTCIQAGANVNQPDNNKRTALMEAACNIDSKCLERLLEAGVDVNMVSQCYHTAVKLAVEKSCHKNIELLLNAGADANLGITNSKYPTLSEAVKAAETELVHRLQRAAFDMTSVKTIAFNSPLMLASQISDMKSAELLIQAGAQVNAVNNNGESAIIMTTVSGSCDMLKFLIQNGADVNICDVTGSTALHYAAKNGYLQCMEILISANATIDPLHNTCLTTPLLLAIEYKHFDCVKLLLHSGADVNRGDTGGKTAIMKASLLGDENMIKLITKSGADLNVTISDGKTPLIMAVENSLFECVDMILQSGADANHCDKHGCTAVIYAAINNDITSLKNMLQAGVRIRISDIITESKEKVWNKPWEQPQYQGKKSTRIKSSIVTFLHKFVPKRKVSIKSAYAEIEANYEGIDLDVPFGINNTTALMAAARRGHFKAVEVLIHAGAAVNVTDRRYNTALMIAAASPVSGSIKCIQLLLKAGAHINKTNLLDQNGLQRALVQPKEDTSALYTAKEYYILEINAKLLFAAGETVEGDTVEYQNPIFPSAKCFREVKVPEFFRQKDGKVCLKLVCQNFIRNYLLNLNPSINLFYKTAQLELPPGLRADLLYGMSVDEQYSDYDEKAKDIDVNDNHDYNKDADIYYYKNPDIARAVHDRWMNV